MSGNIREKFKGAKIASLKETRKDAEQKSKTSWGGGNRPGFLEIEEGKNVFKIAPPHNPNHPSIRPKRVAWLECELPELDENGNEIVGKDGKPVLKIYNKPIFIATVHSNVPGIEDPIELYIEMVRKQVMDSIDDKDEREKALYPITGYRDKNKKWCPGMRPSTNYVSYAWKGVDLGRVEFYPQIVKKIEELNIESDPDDDVIEVDCFSDPDSGVYLVIDYDKSAKSGEKYKVNKDQLDFSKYQRKYGDKALDKYTEDLNERRVTDKQLEELIEKESLADMYVDSYSKRDFELAINGLQIFDEKHGFQLFENEEFLSKLAEIESLVPEKKDKDSDIDESFKKTSKDKKVPTVKQISEEETSDEQPSSNTSSSEGFSSWPIPKMKRYLNQYIIEAYDGSEVLPEELTQGELVKWCELAKDGMELPFSAPQPVVEKKELEKPKVQKTTKPIVEKTEEKPVTGLEGHKDADSVRSKIEEIKARRLKQQS